MRAAGTAESRRQGVASPGTGRHYVQGRWGRRRGGL